MSKIKKTEKPTKRRGCVVIKKPASSYQAVGLNRNGQVWAISETKPPTPGTSGPSRSRRFGRARPTEASCNVDR